MEISEDVLVDVVDEFGPVKDAGGHVPREDEAEFLLVKPVALDVVDLELDICGDKRGHIGTEVVADDLLSCQ